MSDIIQESDFFLYWGEDGKQHAQVILGEQTVWMSQKSMSEVFDVDRSSISKHIQNILDEKELSESNVQLLHIANSDKPVSFYNLDMIIAIGYRVNSYKATKFRQWATRILNEYLIKGFVLDDERLKQGNKLFGKDYFRELLDRIREIRASERMFYEKIKGYYMTSIDYDPTSPKTHHFFAHAQDKLEFAVIGMTSSEIVKSRANALSLNMGLKTYKNINRDGVILRTDAKVGKNYLTKEELSNLNLLVTMFLDYLDNYISRFQKPMKMSDYDDRLDAFLNFNQYQVLNGYGKVRRADAEKFAEAEYEKFKLTPHFQPNSVFKTTFTDIIKTGELPKETPPEQSKKEDKPSNTFNQNLVKIMKVPHPEKEIKPVDTTSEQPKKKRGRPKKDKPKD